MRRRLAFLTVALLLLLPFVADAQVLKGRSGSAGGSITFTGPTQTHSVSGSPGSSITLATIGFNNLGSVSGATTVDWANGHAVHVTATAAVTFTLSNPVDNTDYYLAWQQDGTGGFVPTWPASVVAPGGGSCPPPNLAANALTIFRLRYRSSNTTYYCSVDRTGRSGEVGFVDPGLRLSAATGTPVTATNVTSTSIFYTPYKSGNYTCYDGSAWTVKTITEKTLALTATADKNYDVFIDCNTDVLSLGTVWTDGTTRAEALATQNGVLVKTADATKLYLGTIRITSVANTVADTAGGVTTQVGGQRFIWNMYNRVPRHMQVIDTADNWAVTTSWVVANGATVPLNAVEFVVGQAGVRLMSIVRGYALGTAVACFAAPSLDANNAPATGALIAPVYSAAGASASAAIGEIRTNPSVGYHYSAWVNKESGADCDMRGDDGANGTQSGLYAEIEG